MNGFMDSSGFGMAPTLLTGPNTGNLMGATTAPASSLSSGSFSSYAGTAGGVLSISGAVSSAIGAYYSAQSAKNTLKHQAAMGKINAQVSELGAKSALLQGQRAEQASRMQTTQLKSRQKVSMAANGIDLGSQTAVNILTSTDYMGETDALTIQRNALQAAWGHRMSATNANNAALMSSADASGISAFGSAATSLLGSASSVAGKWYAYNKQQGF